MMTYHDPTPAEQAANRRWFGAFVVGILLLMVGFVLYGYHVDTIPKLKANAAFDALCRNRNGIPVLDVDDTRQCIVQPKAEEPPARWFEFKFDGSGDVEQLVNPDDAKTKARRAPRWEGWAETDDRYGIPSTRAM